MTKETLRYLVTFPGVERRIRKARAEGFRAARERVSAFLWSDAARDFLGGYAPVDKDLNRMVRWLARRIDAMEDAGEGGEPPLSQLRAATERMEAATSAECRWCDQPIRRREGRWHHSRSPLLDATHQPSPRDNQG
jgi:hypothetical protein